MYLNNKNNNLKTDEKQKTEILKLECEKQKREKLTVKS